jgi:hypothetical protein
MDFSVPPIPNNVCVPIRLKMPDKINGVAHVTLDCHYGETNDAFLVGGLVQLSETLMAGAIRHCRHLVSFRLTQNGRLYLVKIMDGFMDHEPLNLIYFIF